MTENPIFDTIKTQITSNDVVLYMKGKKDIPQCGFSAGVSNVLQQLGVEFLDVNVLENPEMREGIKQFTDWPTIPQLYIQGEFIGGFDIVKEMYEAGELQELLKEKGLGKAA